MPRKFYKKKRPVNRRRRFNRRRRYGGKSKVTLMTRDTSGFTATALPKRFPIARTFKRALPYFETGLAINPPIGGLLGSYVFQLNGLYDPNITGAGHQPLGFDQLMLMYEHGTVIGAQAKVDFTSLDTIYHQIVGLYISTTSTTESDVRKVIENGSCVWQVIGPQGSGIESVASLSIKTGVEKFMGLHNIMSSASFYSTSTANATDGLFLHIFCVDHNQNYDTAGVSFNVYLNQISVFTQPRELAIS